VWPATVLLGAGCAASVAAGVWIGALSLSERPPWPLGKWVAEHALWGTAAGALTALALRLLSVWRHGLRDPDVRRRLGARSVSLGVVLGFAPLLATHARGAAETLGPLAGLACGLLAWAIVLRIWLHAPARRLDPPALDAPRVAIAVALLTLPLAGNRTPRAEPEDHSTLPATESPPAGERNVPSPTSLREAWQVMLGP